MITARDSICVLIGWLSAKQGSGELSKEELLYTLEEVVKIVKYPREDAMKILEECPEVLQIIREALSKYADDRRK